MMPINYCSQWPQRPSWQLMWKINFSQIPLYCPCPEARIWPLDILGRAVKLGDSPNPSQTAFPGENGVCWGEPQEIQMLSAGVYKKDSVLM